MKLQIIRKKKFRETEIVTAFVGKVMMTNKLNIIMINGKINIRSIIKYFPHILSCYLIQMLIKIAEFNLPKKIIIIINTVKVFHYSKRVSDQTLFKEAWFNPRKFFKKLVSPKSKIQSRN